MFQETTHPRTAHDNVIHRASMGNLGFLQMTAELMEDALSHDSIMLRSMKQELSLLDNASLHIRGRGASAHFSRYDRTSRQETGITQDPDLVHSLARRSFLENRIRLIKRNDRHLQKALNASRDAIEHAQWDKQFRRFSEANLDLVRILFTPEQIEWINTPYSPNPHHPEDLRYPTAGGLYTRSKSEAKIGSTCEDFGLPYRFDDFTRIDYNPLGDRPFRDSYYSDFKIPNLCGGITIHEHLGAFQMNRYGDNALMRLNDYHNFGVTELPTIPVSPNEFTWSFENDLYDQKRLRRLFRRILLPGIDF